MRIRKLLLFRCLISLSLGLVLVWVGCQPTSPSPSKAEPTHVMHVEQATASAGEVAGTPASNTEPSIEERVEDLLSQMTLAEKVGQMTLVQNRSIREADISKKFIGGILSGGGGYPKPNTPEAWLTMVKGYQESALKTRLAIPLIYGVDAVHGHNNVEGAVIFPHNIGLGATRDPELVERVGRATAEEVAATGIPWNYAPVVAVPQDIRWGRTYEGYSENTELVSELAVAYLKGLQNIDANPDLSHPTTVLGTPKHYVGDGGTAWGTSTTEIFSQYQLDQGVTEVDEGMLRAVHLPPYQAAIDAGAMSIMVSFSSWDGLKMHAHKYLLTDVLKGDLGFEGFIVSDWAGIDQIPGDYDSDVVTAINAGVDMVMVPDDYTAFIDALTKAVERGDVPLARVDDAVRRILTAKFQLGLFERPLADASALPTVGSAAHRDLAREAVRESLVLLKNADGTLPLSKDASLIFVAGKGADDIGIQCGGWTIEWQGEVGSITPGTTILDAIRDTVSEASEVRYNPHGKFDRILDAEGALAIADIGIAVVGEMPYAEGVGDRSDLGLSASDLALLERLRAQSKRLVVILLSGRPMIVSEQLGQWDAFVAAWLPGTEGQGVADVLFGDDPFTGKLPYTWPRNIKQIPLSNLWAEAPPAGGDIPALIPPGCDGPLFPFGYGLGIGDKGVPAFLDCS